MFQEESAGVDRKQQVDTSDAGETTDPAHAVGSYWNEEACDSTAAHSVHIFKVVMVSVGVSALGCTELIFIEPGVKINGQYCRDVLLMEHLLPAIKELSGEFFAFQQDSASAHGAKETVALLDQETPDFITPLLCPPNSPDLNPVDYKVWGVLQERVYHSPIRDV